MANTIWSVVCSGSVCGRPLGGGFVARVNRTLQLPRPNGQGTGKQEERAAAAQARAAQSGHGPDAL